MSKSQQKKQTKNYDRGQPHSPIKKGSSILQSTHAKESKLLNINDLIKEEDEEEDLKFSVKIAKSNQHLQTDSYEDEGGNDPNWTFLYDIIIERGIRALLHLPLTYFMCISAYPNFLIATPEQSVLLVQQKANANKFDELEQKIPTLNNTIDSELQQNE